jgi:hypothetical protein
MLTVAADGATVASLLEVTDPTYYRYSAVIPAAFSSLVTAVDNAEDTAL